MGQHRLPRHVADGVDAGDVGALLLVDGDEPLLDLHPDRLEAQVLRVRAAANGDHHLVGVDRLVFSADVEGDDRAPVLLRPRLGLGPGEHLDAERLEPARHQLRRFRIVAGKDGGQRLDDRHLGAELGVEGADLDADVAAADHDEPLGHGREVQRAGRVDDPLAVELEPRNLDRPRAGGDDDRAGLDRRRCRSLPVELDGVAGDDARVARAVVAAVGLEQRLHAAGQLADDLPFQVCIFPMSTRRLSARMPMSAPWRSLS